MKDRINNSISLNEFERTLYTKDEINLAKANAKYLCMLSDLRKKHKITQKQLESLSGIKQPMIARIEQGDTVPTVTTLIRLLEPMGYTLQIVPIKKDAKL